MAEVTIKEIPASDHDQDDAAQAVAHRPRRKRWTRIGTFLSQALSHSGRAGRGRGKVCLRAGGGRHYGPESDVAWRFGQHNSGPGAGASRSGPANGRRALPGGAGADSVPCWARAADRQASRRRRGNAWRPAGAIWAVGDLSLAKKIYANTDRHRRRGLYRLQLCTRYMLGKYPDYRIVVLDALTYAGNLDNLADVWKNPNFTFIQGDINDAALVNNLAQNADAIVNFRRRKPQ